MELIFYSFNGSITEVRKYTPPPLYPRDYFIIIYKKKSLLLSKYFSFLIGLKISKLILIQGNLRKGLGRCRISCLLHYIHDLSIPLHTISWDDISRSLFANSPGGQSFAFYFFYLFPDNLNAYIRLLWYCTLFMETMIFSPQLNPKYAAPCTLILYISGWNPGTNYHGHKVWTLQNKWCNAQIGAQVKIIS